MGFVTYYSIFPKTYEFSNSKINNNGLSLVSARSQQSPTGEATCLRATLLFLFIAEQSRAGRPVNRKLFVGLKQCLKN